MTDVAGRTEALKKRLITLIAASDNALNSDSVSGHQDKVYSHIRGNKLPYCTVRLGPSSDRNVIGRRVTTTTGRYVNYPFSIHIFVSACGLSGESRNRYGHQLGDNIMDYLDSRRASEGSNKIVDIYAMRMREAKVVGAGMATVRMIIDGEMLTVREDV